MNPFIIERERFHEYAGAAVAIAVSESDSAAATRTRERRTGFIGFLSRVNRAAQAKSVTSGWAVLSVKHRADHMHGRDKRFVDEHLNGGQLGARFLRHSLQSIKRTREGVAPAVLPGPVFIVVIASSIQPV